MPTQISESPGTFIYHGVCMGKGNPSLAGEERIEAVDKANKSLQSSWNLRNVGEWVKGPNP